MFTYFYRILDRYNKPVTTIAIFTDVNKNFHPNIYEYEYLGTHNIFRFNTYQIADQDEKLLKVNPNPFAVVVLTVLLALKKKELNDEGLYELKYSLAKNLLSRKISRRKIDDLLIFLQRYVRFADSGYNVKFDNEIEVLTSKQRTMGIREQVLEMAKMEGLAEGKTEVVKNLLTSNRFTIAEISNFAGVSEVFVAEVKKALKKSLK
ncbi:hypothetical protein [Dyadobacter psychrotolerans]|uniref:Transposase (putative) YhgA-like domain-containing protein n=1 Tax=Dyadobacter psychrotolerans TaxID=2541721 RepID=A0A4V2Z3B0_9BACT|nr:hypothetical protein [Dyadobacter psychrotolerans]TDE11628.1 hypothetical protein E0F88_24695 [Dyadobacter psychrotolerans]